MTGLVDSWAWREYFKGSESGKKARSIIESGKELLISSINISEIYLFFLRNKPNDADKLTSFVLKSSFNIPLEPFTAIKAAAIKNEHKIGLADAIVMATATEHNAEILTGDSDFKNMKSVIYIGK